ncbi:twin-arginine translocase TatA/TatE family subunit [Novosphingobium album (ex Hu et al. 2023)]|uniref:Sec-independent protein translocase protein TatA n=1 Tax=Novosphingobium album (ex Hu et al. 2023) TaxID=2930093 RepID=A0ABT0B0N0_9SPHN|nr:twin-arginine translocase TatA/TatE family subunit [Novosphingobium album (ex Hu et al. 2023)]MCJ2178486.1 twin-arginine translocase TatA/TatE family subunit [Novosphingobium album (ex Hu et al. 2023)]
MGSFSIWHWLIVLVIVLVLFGRGRVSEIMGDFGKGIKSFKDGMNEEEKKASTKTSTPPAQITAQQGDASPSTTETKNEQA